MSLQDNTSLHYCKSNQSGCNSRGYNLSNNFARTLMKSWVSDPRLRVIPSTSLALKQAFNPRENSSVPCSKSCYQDGIPGYSQPAQPPRNRNSLFQKSQCLRQAGPGTGSSCWHHRLGCFTSDRSQHPAHLRPRYLRQQQHQPQLCSGLDLSDRTLSWRSRLHSRRQFPLRPRGGGPPPPGSADCPNILGISGLQGDHLTTLQVWRGALTNSQYCCRRDLRISIIFGPNWKMETLNVRTWSGSEGCTLFLTSSNLVKLSPPGNNTELDHTKMITVLSLCYYVTMLLCYYVTMLLCYYVTMSLC